MPDDPIHPTPPPSPEEEALFHQLNELTSPIERAALLDRMCAGKPELRRRIECLLAAAAVAGGYLKEDGRLPAAGETITQPGFVNIAEGPGSIIGRYKLLQKLGEGGMGVVYLAEQTEPFVKRVALKIIKLGMDTRQVVARFEAERQALALMDHPNIAKVLDGGATDAGRPYFVMQLVKGVSITDFCDHENLSTKERLELFNLVCDAVQHAHAKGIIHRDLKPSNVLVATVDGKPVPVVIDFGVAKAINQRLTEKTLFTRHGQFIGTPAYISPEQASPRGTDIDTRTDVYSLGVLLYELLIGKMPFDKHTLLSKGYEEIYRIISEEDPLKPSTRLSTMTGEELSTLARHRRIDPRRLGRLLRGDIDWIVMKAIEKDRGRRYDTPTRLAEDVRRFLIGETVSAVAPTTGYQLRRFVRRHRKTVAAVGTIVVLLSAAATISTWQWIEANRARVAASRSAREAEEVIRFLNEMLEEVRPAKALGKDTALLKELLDQTAARVSNELKTQPPVEVRLLATMGRTYEALGDFAAAERLQSRALAVARELFGNAHTNVAALLIDLSLTEQWRGDYLAASNHVSEALALSQRLAGPHDALTARAMHRLGSIARFAGDTVGGENWLTNALAMQRKLFGEDDPATLYSGRDLAIIYFDQQKYSAMEPVILRVNEARRRINGAEHPDTLKALELLGLLRMRQGRYPEAEAHMTELVSTRRKILPATHPHLFTSLDYLALVYSYQGRYAEAEATCRLAVEGITRTEGPDTERALVYRSNLAEHIRNQGRYEEAETMFRTIMAAHDRVLPAGHLNRFETLNSLAVQYQLQGKFAEAEALARECLNGRTNQTGLPANDPQVADALAQLVMAMLAQGKFAAAEPLARECLRVRALGPGDDWRLAVAQSQLGDCLLELNRVADAELLLIQGYESLKRFREYLPAIDRRRLNEAGERLVKHFTSTNQPDKAAPLKLELSSLRTWAMVGTP